MASLVRLDPVDPGAVRVEAGFRYDGCWKDERRRRPPSFKALHNKPGSSEN